MITTPLEGIKHMLNIAPRGAYINIDLEVFTAPEGIKSEWSIYVREDVDKTLIGIGETFEAALAEYYQEAGK